MERKPERLKHPTGSQAHCWWRLHSECLEGSGSPRTIGLECLLSPPSQTGRAVVVFCVWRWLSDAVFEACLDP